MARGSREGRSTLPRPPGGLDGVPLRALRRAAPAALALSLLAGCYGAGDWRNPDLQRELGLCNVPETSRPAIAACRAFLARPDPARWPGGTGDQIYGYGLLQQTIAAVRLTLHLSHARQFREAVEAADLALRMDARATVVLVKIRGGPFPPTAPFPPKSPYPPASRGLALACRGHAMAALGDIGGGLPSVREATTLLPTWSEAWVLLATMTNATGAFEESLAALDRAIAVNAALADRAHIQMLRQASQQRRVLPPRLPRWLDMEASRPESRS